MTKFSNTFSIVSFFLLFAISIAILLIASTAKAPVSSWGGILDVGIVVLIVFVGFMIHQRNKGIPRDELSHQIAIYLFPLITACMWIFRGSLDFNILLPGVAWRTYFFLSTLPQALSLWKRE